MINEQTPLTSDTPLHLSEKELEHERRDFHIQKLKNSAIASLFRFIRQTPHLSDQVFARIERQKDFVHSANDLSALHDTEESIDANERLRRLVPIWSALFTVDEMRAHLDLALTYASMLESDAIKKELRKNPPYIGTFIVGAGLHAAIFDVEFLHQAPNVPTLSADGAQMAGGQFRRYGGPVLNMNTPNRPINEDVEGQADNFNVNSLGKNAPVQLTDISGKLFADSQRIGMLAGLVQYLSSDTALGVRVEGFARSKENEPGRYCAYMRDTTTNEVYRVFTDEIIVSTGLGEAQYGFSQMDKTTTELCTCGDGRVMTYTEFMERAGDRTDPFRLSEFEGKDVAIVGGGDSSFTVGELLLGNSPEETGQVTSLGGPRSIRIIGTKFANRNQMNNGGAINRYLPLGVAIDPENASPDARKRIITPMTGLRASRLEEVDETKRMRVVCRDKVTGAENIIEADVVISTTGFDTEFGTMFTELLPPETKVEIADLEDFFVPGYPHPVARTLKGHPHIKFIGGVTGMQMNEMDKKRQQVFNSSGSPVALPALGEKTRLLGEFMGTEARANGKTYDEFTFDISERAPRVRATKEHDALITTYTMTDEELELGFAPEIDYNDILQIRALSCALDADLSPNEVLTLSVQKTGTADFVCEIAHEGDPAHARFLELFASDPLVRAALNKLIGARRKSKNATTLSLLG